MLFLDEAFSAMDTLTTKPTATSIISEVFSDSIVLAVDHHPIHRESGEMSSFYTDYMKVGEGTIRQCEVSQLTCLGEDRIKSTE